MCYVKLRGLVYFGSSIHVYHGLMMLVNLYYDLYGIRILPPMPLPRPGNTSPSSSSSSTQEMPLPPPMPPLNITEIDILFSTSFFVLGILIFRGVEQKSKSFIKWPTILFSLLLAFRFIVEIVKQLSFEGERLWVVQRKHRALYNSPFSYSSMSIDVDPLISASVGIYIFVLFVYNHSLEYGHPERRRDCEGRDSHPQLPPSCASSDASSDTILLLNTLNTSSSGGDSNNNNSNNALQTTNNAMGHSVPASSSNAIATANPSNGFVNIVSNNINTRSNPMFELGRNGMGVGPLLHLPYSGTMNIPRSQDAMILFPDSSDEVVTPSSTPPEYRIDAV